MFLFEKRIHEILSLYYCYWRIFGLVWAGIACIVSGRTVHGTERNGTERNGWEAENDIPLGWLGGRTTFIRQHGLSSGVRKHSGFFLVAAFCLLTSVECNIVKALSLERSIAGSVFAA